MNCVEMSEHLGVKVLSIQHNKITKEITIETEETDKTLTVKNTETKLDAITGMKLKKEEKIE